ncbi:hypothetical protein BRARA_G03061 [Brassica rapa]|uniref:FKB95-like N-terminal Kelch domain-containing protein n=1 Tax=Brassica campestris TaxID=3711 RepID=A0A397YXN9_BRACM|nr:hypothetical protein BRARA_G03061 [Brassica rapa]
MGHRPNTKRHRSLVAAPELCITRWLIGCTEASQYVCLHIFPNPNPSWFVLTETRRLRPIPSNPYQAPESSSFVVVDWGIYVLGGIINRCPTSEVWFLDCFSHTWSRVPSMNMPRASASASLVDGKIYVFGGCEGDDSNSSNWAEVFDPKTQTWSTFATEKMFHSIDQSVVIQGKKVYTVDEEDQSFYFLPRYRSDWCAIGELLFCRGTRGRILWCEPDELDWKEVKGLEELQESFCGSRHTDIKYDISKLCCNSAGNIVIFWNTQLEYPEGLELRSAEISLERHEGGAIWGKIEWSGVILRDDPLSYSFSLKVLYSAPVYS